jgi:hypothetical protein
MENNQEAIRHYEEQLAIILSEFRLLSPKAQHAEYEKYYAIELEFRAELEALGVTKSLQFVDTCSNFDDLPTEEDFARDIYWTEFVNNLFTKEI